MNDHARIVGKHLTFCPDTWKIEGMTSGKRYTVVDTYEAAEYTLGLVVVDDTGARREIHSDYFY